MVWARFDDQYPDHPKVIEAGPLAAWLNVCAICYASRYLTDGFIPAGQIRKLADLDNPMRLVEKLVEVGLWERSEGGFRVHDYLEYNPSREKVLAEREAARRRMNSRRSAEVRPNIERTNGDGSDELPVTFNDPVPTPVPVPKPKPKKNTDSHESVATAVAPPDTPHGLCQVFLDEMGAVNVAPKWFEENRAHAKDILEQGYTDDDLRAFVRYLRATGKTEIRLRYVAKDIHDWEVAGKPTAPHRNGTRRDNVAAGMENLEVVGRMLEQWEQTR